MFFFILIFLEIYGMKKVLALISMTLFCMGSETLYVFNGDETVLDLFCEEGDHSLKIAKIVHKGAVVGVDFSKSVIESAKKKHLQAPSRLSFKFKESNSYGFPCLFDIITSFNIKKFILKDVDSLQAISLNLKEKGYFDAEFINKLPCSLLGVIQAQAVTEKWRSLFTLPFEKITPFTHETLEKELSTFNLDLLKIQKKGSEEVFHSYDSFKEFIAALMENFASMPSIKKEEFVEDVALNYLKVFPKDERGDIHFLVEKLEMLARKKDHK